jgi:hypothetical protein
MAANVYIVVSKLFIRLNPVYQGQKMTPMPSAQYGFLSSLHNIYTTATTYHIYFVGEAIYFLACNYEFQI